jgi:hypothetical protein
LRVGDRERVNHVDRLRKTLRIGPNDFADLVSGYPKLTADDRAKERVDPRLMVIVGEAVEPDQTPHRYVQTCLFPELTPDCGYRRLTVFDSPTRGPYRLLPICCPGQQHAPVSVERNANRNGNGLRRHRPGRYQPPFPVPGSCARIRRRSLALEVR